MKEEISFTQVPFDYPLCLNGQCPKAATCLRQLAMQSMPTEKDYWKIISPKRLATVKGECPFYRSSQKARYAKGFMNMLNSLPYNKRGIAIANLIAGFGQRTYYRARKGERLLLPEEQQSVLNVFRHLDAGMATNFANSLPHLWQNFAMPMAKVCQRGGKVLPIRWQKLVNLLARRAKYSLTIFIPHQRFINSLRSSSGNFSMA